MQLLFGTNILWYDGEILSLIVSIVGIIINIVLISLLIFKTINKSDSLRAMEKCILRYAFGMCIVCLIKRSLDVFVSCNLIIPFSIECNDGYCIRCTICGIFSIALRSIKILIWQTLFIEIYAIYSQISFSKLFLFRIWCLLLWILTNLFFIFSIKYSAQSYNFDRNSNYTICSTKLLFISNKSVLKTFLLFLLIIFQLFTLIIFCILIVTQTISSIKKRLSKDILIKKAVSGLIRHCILSFSIFIFWIIQLIIIQWIYIYFEPFCDIFQSIIIYCFFSFGNQLYVSLFGCYQICLLKIWNCKKQKKYYLYQKSHYNKINYIDSENKEFKEEFQANKLIIRSHTTPHEVIYQQSQQLTRSVTISSTQWSQLEAEGLAKNNNISLCIKFNVSPKYFTATQLIFNKLHMRLIYKLYNIPDILRIISEYGSTIYSKCIMCGEQHGYVECYNDFYIINCALCCINENDDIRYYLNCDPSFSRYIQSNINNYDDNIEIFCVECGLKWKCSICGTQFLSFSHETLLIPGGCELCESIICEDCAVVYNKTTIICTDCGKDKSITTVESYKSIAISNTLCTNNRILIKTNTNNINSEDDPNHWSQWDFDF